MSGKSPSLRYDHLRIEVVVLTALVVSALVARFIAHLFAGREDSATSVLYIMTNPFVAPFHFLDAAQPRYGAVWENAALVAVVASLLVGYGIFQLTRYLEKM